MKLYASTVCLGLLVVFVCNDKTPKPVVVSEFCQNTKIIRGSRKDTPETLAQIRAENAKIRRHCPRLKEIPSQ